MPLTWSPLPILVCSFLLALLAVLVGRWQRQPRKGSPPVAPLVDPDAPCPSCGHREGTLKFTPSIRLIVHTCAVCSASWGEKTVVDTAGWLKPS